MRNEKAVLIDASTETLIAKAIANDWRKMQQIGRQSLTLGNVAERALESAEQHGYCVRDRLAFIRRVMSHRTN